MHFSDRIKAEILSKPPKEQHCKKALIAGLIRGSGVLYENDGVLGLEFKAFDEETAFMLTSAFKAIFDYDIREITVEQDVHTKKDKFYLSITGERAIEILKDLEVLEEKGDALNVNLSFYGNITKKECCLRAFIRGLFIASGSCTLPTENDSSSTGYHLEINFSHYTPALDTSNKLAEFGVLTKIVKRREGYIVYIKSVEEIKDFIAFLKQNYNNKKIAIVAHKAPQLALDVIIKNMTWEEALANDWRLNGNWQPGWEYYIN